MDFSGYNFSYYTLGCRLNIAETENIVSKCVENGFNIVDFGKSCDISFVNTCTVTGQAGIKSRNIISRALKNAKLAVFVSGCHYKEVASEFVNDKLVVIENKKKGYTFDIIDSYLKGELLKQDSLPINQFQYHSGKKTLTKAFCKIQDGCDNKCSFCIIPMTRGVAISRPFDEIMTEISELVKLQYKEIVLTGINLGRYFFQTYDTTINFYTLLSNILKSIPKDVRLSISSLEPYDLSEDFVNLFKEYPNLVRHVHLCLQSGSDKILLKMRREYLVKDFMKIVTSLKQVDEKFNISTDIMVGYPQETDEDFQKTLDAIRECEFSHIHVFPYSDRAGTISSRLTSSSPDTKVADKVKKERVKTAIALGLEVEKTYKRRFIDHEDEVLIFKQTDSYLVGDSKYYQKIVLPNSNHENNYHNQILSVKITGIIDDAGNNHGLDYEICKEYNNELYAHLI